MLLANKINILFLFALYHSTSAATDIYNGKVSFTGAVENAACAISAGDVTGQTVDLGNVRLAEISGMAGKAAAAKIPFQITLEECAATVATKAAITFTGTTAPGMDSVLVGTGDGVGIQIFDNSGQAPLRFGLTSAAYSLNPGQSRLGFLAGFASTTPTPGVGAVTARANFRVSYL